MNAIGAVTTGRPEPVGPAPRAVAEATAKSLVEIDRPARLPVFAVTVERFCRENLRRPIGVDDMARVANMSRFHFMRMFTRAYGMPPGRYLARLRLRESVRLLVQGTDTLQRIADACGYTDANYLAKVFRRTFGIPPTAFRAGVVGGRLGTPAQRRARDA